MNPPRDYPLADPDDQPLDACAAQTLPVAISHPLTVAALYDRHDAQLPITDAMIADAYRTLHAAEPYLV